MHWLTPMPYPHVARLAYQFATLYSRYHSIFVLYTSTVDRNIRRDYADLDGDVVQMAIESCDYDENLIRGVLDDLAK